MIDASFDLAGASLDQLWRAIDATGHPRRLLEIARDEDLGPPPPAGSGRHHTDNDVTSSACAPAGTDAAAVLTAREPGVLSGLAATSRLLDVYDAGARLDVEPLAEDGQPFREGDRLAALSGDLRALLAVERPMLNLIGRLSGIATRTAAFVARARDARPSRPPDVLDTRKTTPGWRLLEKYAVRCGGGSSHRLGLHDAVLIKDNQLAGVPTERLARHVADAARAARDAAAAGLRFVQAEVDTLEQLDALLTLPAGVIDIVLLDNMAAAQLAEAVRRRDALGARPLLEASGGITLDTIADVARTGVDRVSVGSLTHAARSIDLALDRA